MSKVNPLKVFCIQYNIVWENPEENRQAIEKLLFKNEGFNLYVLPETFSTGFTIKEDFAETMSGNTLGWIKKTAQKIEAAIMGSLIIEENGRFYNRMILVEKDGTIQFYNKFHLFNYGSEGKCFTAGEQVEIFDLMGWKIKPIICYDLRFPVAIRNVEDYDLLICVANWPHTRIEAWDTLLKARAIENQCYVVGVNRVGKDGNGLTYCGNSAIIDPMGVVISLEKETNLFYANLNKEVINETRKKFPFLKDRDLFHIVNKA